MKRKLYIGGGVLTALVLAFLGGRFSGPVKVTERVITIEKTIRDEEAITKAVAEARAAWDKQVKDHTITRTLYREGKVVERIVYMDRETTSSGSSSTASTTDLSVKAHEATETATLKEKITERARPRFKLALAAPPSGPLDLRAISGEADVRVLGTIWAGVRYTHTDKTPLRLAVGVEF